MDVSRQVIGLAIEVHRQLGPGLLEFAYEECLCQELRDAGLPFARQVALPIIYKGRRLDFEYRMDIAVDPGIVLEIKARYAVSSFHSTPIRAPFSATERFISSTTNTSATMIAASTQKTSR